MDPEDPEQQSNLPKKSKFQKKWEVFPGKNAFYCDGRLISGRNRDLDLYICHRFPSGVKHLPWIFYMAAFFIIITFVMFLLSESIYLAKHLSPALPVIVAVLFVFLFSNFLIAAFTDPGIIPRSTKREADLFEREMLEDEEFYRKIEVKGQMVYLPYCPTCKIIRPPRASHCRSCDNCVEMWDHHCPWLGNCVGRRNYRHFYNFLVLVTIGGVLLVLCCLVHLFLLAKEVEGGITFSSFLNAVSQSPVSVLVIFICLIGNVFTLGLTCFHTRLLLGSTTTRDKRKGTSNPNSRENSFVNYALGLCAPRPPSLIDARGQVVSPDCDSSNSYNRTDSSTTSSENEYVAASKHESSPGSKSESWPESKNATSLYSPGS